MLLTLLALGCTDGPADTGEGTSSDTGPSFCEGAAPEIQIGKGSESWEEMGDAITMVHGPQGGWHLQSSIQIHNMNDIVLIQVTGYVESTGQEICYGEYRVLSVEVSECLDFYPDMYCYMDVDELEDGLCNTPPELLSGEQVRLEIQVEDQDERAAADTLSLTAEPDPSDSTECVDESLNEDPEGESSEGGDTGGGDTGGD